MESILKDAAPLKAILVLQRATLAGDCSILHSRPPSFWLTLER